MNNIKQVVTVLEQALNVASKGGVFTIKDASTIDKALEILTQYVEEHEGKATAEVVSEPVVKSKK